VRRSGEEEPELGAGVVGGFYAEDHEKKKGGLAGCKEGRGKGDAPQ
jgi:hypothetical protein